ncbi:MAG: alpha/beta fold hydrolase [Phycisphaeraceae bacterium]|nr:alpha/beta fold hydrolase [Phycisphaeraceae bacterium]
MNSRTAASSPRSATALVPGTPRPRAETRQWRTFIFPLLLVLLLLTYGSPARGDAPTAPQQPASGPGGKQYAHSAVTKSVHDEGNGQYWLFEPASPVPKTAPVIVFLHGWGQMNPRTYGAWIDHLAKRGNIVIFPRYQADLLAPGDTFTEAMLTSVKNALKTLDQPGHVTPDRKRFVIVGHSCGGVLAANLAALADKENLPHPRAVMCVQPGRSEIFPLADLSKISADTLLITSAGDFDDIVGDADAQRIFNEATRVKKENKRYLFFRSDDHGRPRVVMHHATPLALDLSYEAREIDGTGPSAWASTAEKKAGTANQYHVASWERPPNYVDYYAYWRPFDALCAAAFDNKHADDAIRAASEGGFMGTWSDGVRIKEPVIRSEPADIAQPVLTKP